MTATRLTPLAMMMMMMGLFLPVRTAHADSPYPPSDYIHDVSFDLGSHVELAPGSDNWPVTWADDGHQYTSWGDGGGFGGTNSDYRVSLGVARVEGDAGAYQGHNVWGHADNSEVQATYEGKSYGILSIDGALYMWIAPGSGADGYTSQTVLRSDDHGHSWTAAPWAFYDSDAVVLPTFLQFGQDYAGARDSYVYVYSIRLQDASDLMVQIPGMIDLMRIPADQVMVQGAYEFFAGLDGKDDPTWTADLAARQPVLSNPNGVGWNVSAIHNDPLNTYFLTTEHYATSGGNIAIYDAPEPWGPWTTTLYEDNWQGLGSTFFWNFSNKWLSADGRDFTLIYTGIGDHDSWNTVDGHFDATARPGDDDDDDDAGDDDVGDDDSGDDDGGDDDAGDDDAGGGDDDGGGTQGCECHASSDSPLAGLLPLALLGIGTRRRACRGANQTRERRPS